MQTDFETTLANSVRWTEHAATYDKGCKLLLSEKQTLAWILKDCLKEFAGMTVEEIIPCIEGEPEVGSTGVLPNETNSSGKIMGTSTEDVSLNEGTITYDVRFIARVPHSKERMELIINVESQQSYYPGYPLVKRAVYYCSRMISAQYGTVFEKAHYEKIKKVYSIWVCAKPPVEMQNTITQYSLCPQPLVGNCIDREDYYDLLSVVMIRLGQAKEENTPQEAADSSTPSNRSAVSQRNVLSMLNVLLSNVMKQEEKRTVLQRDYDMKLTETLEGGIDMCNLGEGLLREGYEKGIEETLVSNIHNIMKNLKLSAEQAMEALNVPKSEWSKYMAML